MFFIFNVFQYWLSVASNSVLSAGVAQVAVTSPKPFARRVLDMAFWIPSDSCSHRRHSRVVRCQMAPCEKKDGRVEQTVDPDLRQTTIRCAGFCPTEVAKIQRRAKAGRNRT
jgi:hypothetical protein